MGSSSHILLCVLASSITADWARGGHLTPKSTQRLGWSSQTVSRKPEIGSEKIVWLAIGLGFVR